MTKISQGRGTCGWDSHPTRGQCLAPRDPHLCKPARAQARRRAGPPGGVSMPYLLSPPRLPPHSPGPNRSRSSGSHWPACSSLARAPCPGHRWPKWLPVSASGEPTGTPGTRCFPSAGGTAAERGKHRPGRLSQLTPPDSWRVRAPSKFMSPGARRVSSRRAGWTLHRTRSLRNQTRLQRSQDPSHCPPSWAPGQTHLLQLTRCLFLLLVLQTEGADGEDNLA